MSSRQPFIHPFNFFIVQYGVENTHTLITQAHKLEALSNLYWFLGWIDPDILEELKTEVGEMESILQGNGGPHFTDHKLRDFQTKIAKKLHEKGYFLAAKMRPPTRESDLHKIEIAADVAKYHKDKKDSDIEHGENREGTQ